MERVEGVAGGADVTVIRRFPCRKPPSRRLNHNRVLRRVSELQRLVVQPSSRTSVVKLMSLNSESSSTRSINSRVVLSKIPPAPRAGPPRTSALSCSALSVCARSACRILAGQNCAVAFRGVVFVTKVFQRGSQRVVKRDAPRRKPTSAPRRTAGRFRLNRGTPEWCKRKCQSVVTCMRDWYE